MLTIAKPAKINLQVIFFTNIMGVILGLHIFPAYLLYYIVYLHSTLIGKIKNRNKVKILLKKLA